MKVDGGDTFQQARNLGVFRQNKFNVIQGKLDDSEGVDWFKFRARSSSGLMSFSTLARSEGGVTVNYDIGVYAKLNGRMRRVPVSFDNYGGFGTGSFSVPRNGVYYLKVQSPIRNDREIDYTLRVGVGEQSWLWSNLLPNISKSGTALMGK